MKKNKIFMVGMLVLVLVFGSVLTSCITSAVVDGVPQNLGLIAKAPAAVEGKAVIASYWETIPLIGWNGILTIGYDDFITATQGRDYNIVRKYFYIIQQVQAVEK